MKLDKEIEPLPADSTLLVRPRSVARPQVRRADARARAAPGSRPGSTIPLRQARPAGRGARRPVQHVRREDARRPAEHARRLRRRLRRPRPGREHRDRGVRAAARATSSRWRSNLSDPSTRLDRFFASLGARGRGGRAGGRGAGLAVREPGHVASPRSASVARPFLQETISESPPSEQVAIEQFPRAAAVHPQQDRPLPRAAARRGGAAALGARSSPTPSRRAPRCCRRRSR